jgi:1-phosphatidylinositol-3-phosphate 5-kinase
MAMEKYILQAPNCWHQFSSRVSGVAVPRRTVVLRGVGLEGEVARSGGGQVLEVEGGEEETAAGSRI